MLATQRLAESVAAVLRPGDVIGLDGDLGAGKTTFVRFVARALGVTTPVTSPTFTLANTYEAPRWPDRAQPLVIHHIDAYRLEGDADAEDLALAELLDSGCIVVVEWAERLTLPPDRLDLRFAFPPDLDADAANIAARPGVIAVPPVLAGALTSPSPGAFETPPNAAIASPGVTVDDDNLSSPAASPPAASPPAAGPSEPSNATDIRLVTVTPRSPTWQARPLPAAGRRGEAKDRGGR